METTNLDSHWILGNPISENNYNEKFSDRLVEVFDTQIRNWNRHNESNDSQPRWKEMPIIENENLAGINYKDDFTTFPNFFLPKPSRINPKEITTFMSNSQKWLGHILELRKDSFSAKLEDLIEPGTYEVGEFYYNEVSREDKEFLQVGAVFYWSVGRSVRNGQVINESIVRFQRLSSWIEDDYNEVLDRVSSLQSNLNWD